MINTSTQYKKDITAENRQFLIEDKYIFSDGSIPEMEMADFVSYSINEATSESGKFSIGAAVIKKYTAVLNNSEKKFSKLDFEGTDILARVGLVLEDGTIEILQKGRYRIVDAKNSGITINIEAYDSMLFFDRSYSESTLTYPATIYEIIADACQRCEMTFDASTISLPNFTVEKRPDDGTLTFRDMISFCAQVMCTYAKISNSDVLKFGWYDFDAVSVPLDGGEFDEDVPYSSGINLDGGTLDPWNTGDEYDSGIFSDMKRYHHIYVLGSQSINTDDILITGIKVTAQSEGTQEQSYQIGGDGYILPIENNPLIQNIGKAQEVGEYIAERMVGRRIRPLSVTCRSDPAIESGDPIIVTDRLQNSYTTVITETSFTLGSMQVIESSAETPTEKSYAKYSAATKLIYQSKKETAQQLSEYNIAVQHMNQLAANTLGYYYTEEILEGGSTIAYWHDKPDIADSEIVYKQGIDGFWLSRDGGETYEFGRDSDGNVIVNILHAIGISFDWAKGGTLTLGGENNENGLLKILNAYGTLSGTWDNESLTMRGTGRITSIQEVQGTEENATSLEIYGGELSIKRGTNFVLSTTIAPGISKPGLMFDTYGGLGFSTSNLYYLMNDGMSTQATGHIFGGNVNVNGNFTVTPSGSDVFSVSDSVINMRKNLDMNGYSVQNTSDERVKMNIEEYSGDALDVVNAIDLYSFDWVENNEHVNIGFVAQQVKEIIPDAVHHNEETDHYSTKEMYMIRYLWKAVQELSAQVDEMKGRKRKKKKFRKSRMSLKNKKKFTERLKPPESNQRTDFSVDELKERK